MVDHITLLPVTLQHSQTIPAKTGRKTLLEVQRLAAHLGHHDHAAAAKALGLAKDSSKDNAASGLILDAQAAVSGGAFKGKAPEAIAGELLEKLKAVSPAAVAFYQLKKGTSPELVSGNE